MEYNYMYIYVCVSVYVCVCVCVCIREGNGTPLQYSCLENPRDRGVGGLLSMGSHRVGHD